MALENQQILDEYNNLVSNSPPPVFFNYRCELTSEYGSLNPIRVRSIHLEEEYRAAYMSLLVVEVEVARSGFDQFLSKSRANFDVKLIKTLRGVRGEEIAGGAETFRTYKGFIDKTEAGDMLQENSSDSDDVQRDLTDTVLVNIQLLETVEKEMSFASAESVYRDVTTQELIEHVLSYGLSDSASVEQLTSMDYRGVRGAEVYKTEDSVRHDFIIVDGETKLIDIPHSLQFNHGVYSAGLGQFYKNGYWHVYPLFDTSRFKEESKTMTVVLMPQDDLPTSERTYMYRSEQLYIFATGEKAIVNRDELEALNNFNAYRFWRSDDLLDTFFNKTGNNGLPNIDMVKKEFTLDKRKDPFFNVARPDRNFTQNAKKASAKMHEMRGRYLIVNWDNGNEDLLVPGMPVKVLYVSNKEIKETFGTLLGATSDIETSSGSLTDTSFSKHTTLSIYLDPE